MRRLTPFNWAASFLEICNDCKFSWGGRNHP
nr:MAG TPA: hypothetical protein [Caudoviricetes sp.]